MRSRNRHYRVWDALDKRMEYFGFEEVLRGDVSLHPVCCDWYLMDSTYFPDKNGKEIYEGDICKMHDWKLKPIRWEQGRFWLGNSLVIICDFEAKNMEVVGNIYENPELLEDGQDVNN